MEINARFAPNHWSLRPCGILERRPTGPIQEGTAIRRTVTGTKKRGPAGRSVLERLLSRGKQWPVDRFADAVNTLSETCPILPVLLGHPTEVPLTWLLESLIKPPCLNVSNCYGGLGGLIGVLSRLDFHLANDNGVMHLADVMDVPQVALFGPTDPRFFGPVGNRTTVVSSEDGTIESIEVEDVLKAVSVRMET